MENLKAPRAFKPLPRYLTPAQVDALLEAPDVETRWGSGTARSSRCSTPPACGSPS